MANPGTAAPPPRRKAPAIAYLIAVTPLGWPLILADIIHPRHDVVDRLFAGTEFDSRTWTDAEWRAIEADRARREEHEALKLQ